MVIGDATISTFSLSKSDVAKLWHIPQGHMSENGMTELSRRGLLDRQSITKLKFYEHCIFGKQKRVIFTKGIHSTKGTLYYIHSDLWEPSRVPSRGEGIVKHLTVRHTPQQNSMDEQMNRTIMEKVHCMLSNAGLPKSFWAEVAFTACLLINFSPLVTIDKKTPKEVWSGTPGSYSNLRIFGCPTPRIAIRPPHKYAEADLVAYVLNVAESIDSGEEPSSYSKAVRDHDKRRSLTCYVFIIGGCAISWKDTLQTTVALSTTKADCTSITEAFKEAIWLKDQMFQERTKHIDIRHHFVSEIIACGDIVKKLSNLEEGRSMNAVQNELWKMLDGRKYLLVLDDVWNEDTLKWSRLKNMLIGGAKGSKILLTTCSDVVAEVSGSAHQHKLGDLLKEDAWTLFGKMVFECNKESKNSNLVEIGKEIVRKCGGIPLAIRSICSLLCQKRTEDEWIYFKNQELSSITRGGNDVMTILRLSFNYLPRHLKICFTYCSLFPKDFLIQISDLIDMWIAQGFIQSTTSNRDDVEEVANSFFMDLFRRSCAGREFFSIIKAEDTEIVPDQTLHASCLFKIDDSSAFPNSFYRKHMKLCTFIYLNGSPNSVISNSTLERMISSFARLRVLHLCHLQIKFLPQSLDGLKHLRYNSISSKSIVNLPNSIKKLHNLQLLNLVCCFKLKKLPRDIWRLVSLRCLDVKHCSSLEYMPPGIGQLTSLRTLTSFIIGKESCISGQASDKLNELKGLVDLRNSLSIKFMGRSHAIGERKPTDVVKRMEHLQQISVKFECRNHEDDTGADLIMLEVLQPHQNIEILEIIN
ncbi:hypothetical protein CQW23_22686 [Capsicum baccatum]|uniref:Integrase catalytic domain-containing protein n=1 Tax=Capsicum baccatum TaxID=33114 RepID=A0A2G2W1N9_CAPBA|nr:hypothetical protein CQW23_22686 [Capsicum baccatum]